MINPIAQSFLIASRSRTAGFWEHDQFANSRSGGPAPRLTPAPRAGQRKFFGLLPRGKSVKPDDL